MHYTWWHDIFYLAGVYLWNISANVFDFYVLIGFLCEAYHSLHFVTNSCHICMLTGMNSPIYIMLRGNYPVYGYKCQNVMFMGRHITA